MTVVGGHATVGWLSNNVFWTFPAIGRIFEKSHWTVTRQWSEVRRPSADCQTMFFGRVKQLGQFLNKVTDRSRDSGRRSRDRRPTVKQHVIVAWLLTTWILHQYACIIVPITLTLSCIRLYNRSIVGQSSEGHATVAWLSSTYNIHVEWYMYLWMRKRESISVTLHTGTAMLCRRSFHLPAFTRHRLSPACERCRLRRVGDWQGQLVDECCQSSHWQVKFMLCGLYSKWERERERERESEREYLAGSCNVQDENCIIYCNMCSNAIMLRKLYGELHVCYVACVYSGELVSLIGNQWVWIFPPKSEIVFDLSLALIWCQNFQDGAIPVGGDTWPSWSAERKKMNEKNIRKLAYADSLEQNYGKNKSLWSIRCATVVRGQATVGRLWNNFLWPFQAFRKFFEKVAERSRASGRRSRDRQLTVKQSFLNVLSDLEKFWKKSLNGHATVVGGHATVGRLSYNVISMFHAIRKIFEKSRWTVTRQWSEVTRPLTDCRATFFRCFMQFGKILKKVAERTVTRQWSEVRRPSADCQTKFFGRFKYFGKILKKVTERSRDSGRRSRDRRPTVKQRF